VCLFVEMNEHICRGWYMTCMMVDTNNKQSYFDFWLPYGTVVCQDSVFWLTVNGIVCSAVLQGLWLGGRDTVSYYLCILPPCSILYIVISRTVRLFVTIKLYWLLWLRGIFQPSRLSHMNISWSATQVRGYSESTEPL
jgi:hypothetical protein